MSKPEHYLVLEPDGELHWIQVTNRKYLAAAFRKAIGTSRLELVSLPFGFSCVVDAICQVRLDPMLMNPLASRFYLGSVFCHPLFGTVVFARFDLIDGEHDWAMLHDEDLARISLITGKPIPDFFDPGIDDQI